jgi:hypothetical protein
MSSLEQPIIMTPQRLVYLQNKLSRVQAFEHMHPSRVNRMITDRAARELAAAFPIPEARVVPRTATLVGIPAPADRWSECG